MKLLHTATHNTFNISGTAQAHPWFKIVHDTPLEGQHLCARSKYIVYVTLNEFRCNHANVLYVFIDIYFLELNPIRKVDQNDFLQ